MTFLKLQLSLEKKYYLFDELRIIELVDADPNFVLDFILPDVELDDESDIWLAKCLLNHADERGSFLTKNSPDCGRGYFR